MHKRFLTLTVEVFCDNEKGKDIHELAFGTYGCVKAEMPHYIGIEWGAYSTQSGWYRGALLHPFWL